MMFSFVFLFHTCNSDFKRSYESRLVKAPISFGCKAFACSFKDRNVLSNPRHSTFQALKVTKTMKADLISHQASLLLLINQNEG